MPDIEFSSNGATTPGYLAAPEAGRGPATIVLQEWWGLDEHIREFPDRPIAGAEDFLYWSKEKFGLTPFITVTHVTIARDAEGDYVMTSKDVYSSRYFDASLTVAIASDAVETTMRRESGPLFTSLATGDASTKLVEAYKLHSEPRNR